jgi:hypothetical protein
MKRELRCKTGTVPAAVSSVENLRNHFLKYKREGAGGRSESEDLPKAQTIIPMPFGKKGRG